MFPDHFAVLSIWDIGAHLTYILRDCNLQLSNLTDLTMGKAFPLLLFICILLIEPLCHAQTSVKVSDPRLEMKDNIIHIYFDILNSDPDEKYNISIDIKDENGKPVHATALDGDIGVVEHGTGNKHITWNLETDNIFIEAYVFVQISAKIISTLVPVTTEPVEEPVQEEQYDQTATRSEELKAEDITQENVSKDQIPEEEIILKKTPPVTKSKSYNRTGIIFQSLVLPGLGLSRVTGKPHWLKGVAGYGCIATSIVLNRKAINTYNEIEDLVNFNEINEAYDKSLRQDNISEILSYAAIGIWITDFIWTLVRTTDLNKIAYNSESSGFSFSSNIDPLSNIPMVSVKYRF